jgi:hypothetical protein
MAIQHYAIKFVSDLRQGSGFLRVLRIPPPIKLTTTIYICNWNIVESGVKHHKPISLYIKQVCIQVLDSIWFYININFFCLSDPTCNVVIIKSAEENAEQSSSFQDDIREIQGDGTLICESIVVREQLTEEFLNVTNDKIPQAKLVFMLFSQAFVKNCWPEICKMKNFNSDIYDSKPLIIPVSAETNTEFPMGMKSAHNLSFHRRDSYYKDALTKLVRQYIR